MGTAGGAGAFTGSLSVLPPPHPTNKLLTNSVPTKDKGILRSKSFLVGLSDGLGFFLAGFMFSRAFIVQRLPSSAMFVRALPSHLDTILKTSNLDMTWDS